MKPRVLIVGDRRRPGVALGVKRALPAVRKRLDVVAVDLAERLDLSTAQADLVLVFGGDGSFLYVAHRLRTNPIPVLGVNFGRLGWLAELQPDELEEGLDAFVAGRYRVSDRSRLRCEHRLGKRVVDEGLALNDVVVGRATLGKMVEIDVRIDGQSAITVAGDGLIVSTAAGSTAHALSAGGPLLVPGLNAVVLVPICPHALGNRPLVVSRSSRIELVLGAARPGAAVVTVDGRDARPLEPGETVEVSDAHAPLRVVSVSGRSYYDQLRLRLGWTGRPVYRGPDAEPAAERAGPLLPDARPAPLGRAAKAARLARGARRRRP
ncbi:MAG: NAD(+)/NADH kinase [Planctomycetota bacterium]